MRNLFQEGSQEFRIYQHMVTIRLKQEMFLICLIWNGMLSFLIIQDEVLPFIQHNVNIHVWKLKWLKKIYNHFLDIFSLTKWQRFSFFIFLITMIYLWRLQNRMNIIFRFVHALMTTVCISYSIVANFPLFLQSVVHISGRFKLYIHF